MIIFTVYEHGNICIAWPNYWAGFATAVFPIQSMATRIFYTIILGSSLAIMISNDRVSDTYIIMFREFVIFLCFQFVYIICKFCNWDR